MNKTEHHNTITELTILTGKLRRRRDDWKAQAKAVSAKLKTTQVALDHERQRADRILGELNQLRRELVVFELNARFGMAKNPNCEEVAPAT